MKNLSLLFLFLLSFSFNGISQSHKSKATAEINKIFGSKYNNISFWYAKEQWEGLKHYYTYYYKAEVSGVKAFKCNSSAKVTANLKVHIWSNGEKRYAATAHGHKIENIKPPNFDQIEKYIRKEFEAGNFNPVEDFNSSMLNDVLEVISVGVVRPGDKEFRINDENFYFNFEDKDSYSENHVSVPIYIEVKRLTSNVHVGKTKEISHYWFKRDECTKPFYLFPRTYDKGSSGRRFRSFEISEQKYSSDEIKEFRKNSIGREMAEKKAKEEWDNLVDVEIPSFENPNDRLMYIRDFLFTASEDEVRSLVMKNLDYKYFYEDSKYILNYSGNDFVEKVVSAIFGDEEINFRTVYCPTIVSGGGKPGKSYGFKSKNGEYSAGIELSWYEDEWRISSLDIALPSKSKFEDVDCPEPVILEDISDDYFSFKAKMPKGFEKVIHDISNGDKKAVYTYEGNGQEYIFYAYKYNSLSNPLPKANLKSTAEKTMKKFMGNYATYEEEYADWEQEGVEGVSSKFVLKRRGGNRSGVNNNQGMRTWYKGIMLGDILYEFIIVSENWSEQDEEFMNSLDFTGSFEIGVDPNDIKYKKGDLVVIGSRRDRGEVKEVNKDGTYKVHAYEVNKWYNLKPSMMRKDPNQSKR